MSNAKILNVLNALTANGGGDGILKFLNGIMIIRSKAIALRTTFPAPFRYPPYSVSGQNFDTKGCVLRLRTIPGTGHTHRL